MGNNIEQQKDCNMWFTVFKTLEITKLQTRWNDIVLFNWLAAK